MLMERKRRTKHRRTGKRCRTTKGKFKKCRK